jgi:general secretion pathway protein E
MSESPPPGLAEALQAAREQCRAGAGSVLDVLLRAPGAVAAEVAAMLRREAGVDVLLEAGAEEPDFSRIDRDTARQWRCVPLRGDGARLAAEDPWDGTLLQQAARKLGRYPVTLAVPRLLIEYWLGSPAGGGSSSTLDQVEASGPIVAFVDQALRSAHRQGASDLHFECDRQGVAAKFRIDGVMQPFARLEGAERAQETISRIKVMSQLDITERRLPQDGRCQFAVEGDAVDVRVSIMPSVHGEDAVLRLLDKARLRNRGASLTLARLGFGLDTAAAIRTLAELPSGMLLVTGPTGSGKTTTVYAALSEIASGQEKIVTIEDPVEYELPGVLQIPVNERKGLTFAKGLRSILRHDPDRILVGEIRDAETAEIAVQSALTGHQVFTTVHANSVSDVVGRFRHFGLDMFGFMSALNGVVVQRLVRRLCPRCAERREATPEEHRWLVRMGQGQASELPVARGCAHCRHTGYDGRFVVAEVHCVDDELRDGVTSGAPISMLKEHARSRGVESLGSVVARHVVDGRTTSEEVKRVVGWG